MRSDSLDERDFELINIVGDKLAISQRDLSRRLNLSLGTINLLIRRLMTKGYIRIRQLDKRKVEYILTPKGFSEKAKKSVRYTIKTIRSVGAIQKQLLKIIEGIPKDSENRFIIIGDPDFSLLVEMILQRVCKHRCHVSKFDEMPERRLEGTVLICREGFKESDIIAPRCVNLIDILAAHTFAGQQHT